MVRVEVLFIDDRQEYYGSHALKSNGQLVTKQAYIAIRRISSEKPGPGTVDMVAVGETSSGP